MGRKPVNAMLNELYIENFAIIDSLRISFSPGMNILSGETGAGKSIIVGAVSVLLGDRVSNDLIRSSAESAVVEARFDIAGNVTARKKLEELDLCEGDELLLARTISRTGRNRIYVNGRLATAGMLSSISESLVNICGQHEHQVLMQKENHIDVLDEFAGVLKEREDYDRRYQEYREITRKHEELKAAGRERRERRELLGFQLDEIEKSGVRAGEDEELAEEKRMLANAQKLRECAGESYDILYGGEGSLLERLGRVRTLIDEIRGLDQSFPVAETAADSLYFGLEDVALTLRDYLGNIVHDPARLEEIDNRLEFLGMLKRKYGGSLKAVLERQETVSRELEELEHVEENLEGMEHAVEEKRNELEKLAADLSARRRDAARALEKAVNNEMADLRMANTNFAVSFEDRQAENDSEAPALHQKGCDEVEFYFSANPGETLKPLNRVASGGELSRLVLALKKVLVHGSSAETVIFDEVDTGIGGAAAQVVGSKLRDISRRHQVVCITHLPQIASFGTIHFLVTKGVNDDRTSAGVRKLDDDDRIEEIARMLGGVKLTEKTREHAREMLRLSQDVPAG
ncbi:MAG: hypothetical protein AVO39_00720 [delta proteobacterium MLS_D]|jgi:DNA repair protein RecN (Recombination protein N)|nr:MAG: hypothetical protein AVO39_00720 [delta proteobacterium MLS_D]